NPCPPHTQNITSSNLQRFQRKKYSRRGSRRALLVPYTTPSPPSRRGTSYRGTTGELFISCSSVAFNDIKHLTRSMPADCLEAQDVVPPRCGCWVAHKPSICLAFSHARARQPSQLSLISLAFLSRVRKHGRQRVSLSVVRDGNGSGGPKCPCPHDTRLSRVNIFPAPLAARPCFQFLSFMAKFAL